MIPATVLLTLSILITALLVACCMAGARAERHLDR
jgi:outer membrane biogenesis lipoprotein LolB